MGEGQPAVGSAEQAIVLEITPRHYRRWAVIFIVLGVVFATVGILELVYGSSFGPLPWGVAAIGYGIYSAHQARGQITRTVLRIDRDGFQSPNELLAHRWAGVVLVWVGPFSGLRLPFVLQPTISVFTESGVSFARRAGTRPSPLYTIPIGVGPPVAELCQRLRALTTAEVVDGRVISRRAAGAALARQRVTS